MKKAEFIQKVAEKASLSKKDATAAVEASIDVITEALAKGDTVNFIGFGAFSLTTRAARKTKVPNTNQIVNVPKSTSVKFRAGKNLKEAVKNTPVPEKK